ncbi:MAG: cytochrome oxidase subunit III [Candidatus Bipolaricaulota bacterium]|nr:cytochrome oxidase subunit III [Candidatus Bipolaricaulota bacterium]MDW8329076.1 cytochrome oxidase subunit III [Candidatus Bipolaricaulota bacterium]
MNTTLGTNGTPSHEFPPTRVALWLFLGVVTMLFAMLLSAYLVRLGTADEHALPKPALLWLNTLVLVLSSLALEGARRRRGERPFASTLWLAGGAFAVLFLLGQLWAWRELAHAGYFLATNPASSFFYLLTALHGLHLLGGLIAWTQTARCVIQEGRGESRDGAKGFATPLSTKLELCALYWHFLLAVWIVILILMWVTT